MSNIKKTRKASLGAVGSRLTTVSALSAARLTPRATARAKPHLTRPKPVVAPLLSPLGSVDARPVGPPTPALERARRATKGTVTTIAAKSTLAVIASAAVSSVAIAEAASVASVIAAQRRTALTPALPAIPPPAATIGSATLCAGWTTLVAGRAAKWCPRIWSVLALLVALKRPACTREPRLAVVALARTLTATLARRKAASLPRKARCIPAAISTTLLISAAVESWSHGLALCKITLVAIAAPTKARTGSLFSSIIPTAESAATLTGLEPAPIAALARPIESPCSLPLSLARKGTSLTTATVFTFTSK